MAHKIVSPKFKSKSKPAFRLLLRTVELILHSILWSLVLTIFAFVFLLILPYRWALLLVSKWLRPDLLGFLGPLGTPFLADFNGSEYLKYNIVVRLKVRGPLNFPTTFALYRDKFVLPLAKNKKHGNRSELLHPELQQCFVKWGGYYFRTWEKDFDIDQHIVHHKEVIADADMDAFQIKYVDEGMPADRSPWQILAVGCGEGSHVVLVKFHHALSDGRGILKTLTNIADEPVLFHEPKRTRSVNIFCKIAEALMFPPLALLELARLSSTNWLNLPWRKRQLAPVDNMTQYKQISSRPLEVSKLRQISKVNSVSFTAVLFAGIIGGLRKLALTKGREDELPQTVPFQMPLPTFKRSEGLENSFGVLSIIVPFGDMDPETRILKCEQMLQSRKNSTQSQILSVLMVMYTLLPTFMQLEVQPPLCLSSFPGPRNAIIMNGQELCDLNFAVQTPRIDVFISILSYNGAITYVFNGDSRWFSPKDVARVGEFIDEAFAEMEND